MENEIDTPDSKVHGAYMGPTWGRQGPGGPHVGPMIFAIWGDTIWGDVVLNTLHNEKCENEIDMVRQATSPIDKVFSIVKIE